MVDKMRWDKTRGYSITVPSCFACRARAPGHYGNLCKKLCKGPPPPQHSSLNPYGLTLPRYDYNDAAEGFYQKEAKYNFDTWSLLSSVILNDRRGVMLWFFSWLISRQSCAAFCSQYSVSPNLILTHPLVLSDLCLFLLDYTTPAYSLLITHWYLYKP